MNRWDKRRQIEREREPRLAHRPHRIRDRQGGHHMTLADAIPTLAAVDTLAGFDAWWAPRSAAINRLSVEDPAEYERIVRAVEAMHERRRRREASQKDGT